jgi:hypothetical protein
MADQHAHIVRGQRELHTPSTSSAFMLRYLLLVVSIDGLGEVSYELQIVPATVSAEAESGCSNQRCMVVRQKTNING